MTTKWSRMVQDDSMKTPWVHDDLRMTLGWPLIWSNHIQVMVRVRFKSSLKIIPQHPYWQMKQTKIIQTKKRCRFHYTKEVSIRTATSLEATFGIRSLFFLFASAIGSVALKYSTIIFKIQKKVVILHSYSDSLMGQPLQVMKSNVKCN